VRVNLVVSGGDASHLTGSADRARCRPAQGRAGARFVRDRTRSDDGGITFVVTVVRDVGVHAGSTFSS
jgi:hypothetical protein